MCTVLAVYGGVPCVQWRLCSCKPSQACGVAIQQEVVLGIKWHEQEMLDLEHWPLK